MVGLPEEYLIWDEEFKIYASKETVIVNTPNGYSVLIDNTGKITKLNVK